MASPFPFTSGQVLTAAQLNSIGEWTTYSPTCTWSTAGSFGFIKYAQVQDLLVLKFKFDLTGAPTGDFGFDLPFTCADGFAGAVGSAALFDSNSTDYQGEMFHNNTQAKITVLSSGTVNATTPFTWANTDSIRGIMTLEIA